MRRLAAGGRKLGPSRATSAIGVIAFVAVVVSAELSSRPAPNPTSALPAEALWAPHNCIVTVLYRSRPGLGLARAGFTAGITPLVLSGSPRSAASCSCRIARCPVIAAGDAMALFGPGGIGSLIWLAMQGTNSAVTGRHR